MADGRPDRVQAADANLYRYVVNSPTNLVDPTGLAASPVPSTPTFSVGEFLGGTSAGMIWKLPRPTPPDGLIVYTHVSMNWTVERFIPHPNPSRVTGSYEYWLDGMAGPPELQFNMSPLNGARMIPNPAKGPLHRKEWPVLKPGRETTEYMKDSFDVFNTAGSLSVRIDYRGYRVRAKEKFKEKLELEQGAPAEYTNPKDNSIEQRLPNRIKQGFRDRGSWLATKPAIWDDAPDWQWTADLSVSWSARNGRELTVTYQVRTPEGSRTETLSFPLQRGPATR